jgi:hypothetical protein
MFNNLFRCSFLDTVEKYCRTGRPQMPTKRRIRIACWEPKATNTLRISSNFFVFHCNNGCTNVCTRIACLGNRSFRPCVHASLATNTESCEWKWRLRFFRALVVMQYVCLCAGRRVTCLRSPHPRHHKENTCRWGQLFPLQVAAFTGARATCSTGMTSE